MVESIIDQGEELSRDWERLLPEFDYLQEGGFYFFQKDERTGLNTEQPVARTSRNPVPLIYRISRVAHALLFNEKSVLFRMLQPLAARIDASPRARRAFGWSEHMAKTGMFGCMNCGDCALFDVAYICPMHSARSSSATGRAAAATTGGARRTPGRGSASGCRPTSG